MGNDFATKSILKIGVRDHLTKSFAQKYSMEIFWTITDLRTRALTKTTGPYPSSQNQVAISVESGTSKRKQQFSTSMIGWRKTRMSCFFHLHYPKSLLSFLLGFQTSSILWTGTVNLVTNLVGPKQKTMRHTLLGTNISDTQGTFEDDFPSPVWWDMDKRSLGNKKNSNPETLKWLSQVRSFLGLNFLCRIRQLIMWFQADVAYPRWGHGPVGVDPRGSPQW